MKKIFYKKGQIQSIAPAILTLIFAAIVLVFGIIALQSLQDTTVDESVTVNNVTLVMNTTAPRIASSNYSQCGFQGFSVSKATMVNQTTGSGTINAGNYTTGALTGTVNATTVDPTSLKNLPWNITYSYSFSSGEACIASNKTIEGIATFADFWEIIILAIVISVVIGLLLVIFGGSSRR